MTYYKPPEPWPRLKSKYLWYRWVVPKHLRDHFGKTEIRKSLKTTDPAEAKRLILDQHNKTLAEVERAEKRHTADRLEQIDRAVDKFFALGAEKFGSMDEFCRSAMIMLFIPEAAVSANEAQAPWVSKALGIEIDPLLVGADQPIDLSLALTQHRMFEQQELTGGLALRETPIRLLKSRNWGPAHHFIEAIVPMARGNWRRGSIGYDRAAELFLRRLAEHRFEKWPAKLEAALAGHSAFSQPVGPTAAQVPLEIHSKPSPAMPAAIHHHPIAPTRTAGTEVRTQARLSEALETWIERARPGTSAILEARRTVKRFISLHGDLRIHDITKAMVVDFRDLLSRMPANIRVDLAIAAGKSFREVVENARASSKWNGNTIAPATVKKDIGALSAIFGVYVNDALLTDNPAAGLRIAGYTKSKKKRQGKLRLPLRETHYRDLFASPLFTGCKGRKDIDRTKPGPYVFQDEMYWTFLFGVTGGPRLEEIGQALIDDVEVFDYQGRTYALIHITGTGEDQSRKTDESIRVLVVHHRLIELGFIEYWQSRKSAGAKRLFDLKKDKTTNKWSKELSRKLNRFIDRVVTDDGRYVWYSTRHSFIDAAIEAEIESQMRRRMVGHAAADVGEQYGLGPSVKKMAANLDKIDLSFIDWDRLMVAAGRSSAK